MSTIKELSQDILTEKNSKIIPENIKKDVQIFDVVGTLESGGSGDVKLFDTVEHMQQDENPQEGDLAIVYTSTQVNFSEDTQTQYITFPETVTLPGEVSGDISLSLRSVDSSIMFDCWGQLSSTGFNINCYSDSGVTEINYSSSDGINYTRTTQINNPMDMGTTVCFDDRYGGEFNELLGYFLIIDSSEFQGLYKYTLDLDDKTKIKFADLDNITLEIENNQISEFKINGLLDIIINRNIIDTVTRNLISELGTTDKYRPIFYIDNNDNLCVIKCEEVDQNITFLIYDKNCNLLGIGNSSTILYPSATVYSVNKNTGELTELQTYSALKLKNREYYYLPITNIKSSFIWCSLDEEITNKLQIILLENVSSIPDASFRQYAPKNEYILAPTQFTLDSDKVYEKPFYGKNGVENGTLQYVTNLYPSQVKFRRDLVNLYSNMSVKTLCEYYKLTGTVDMSDLDVSNVTNADSCYTQYEGSEALPTFNTLKITNAQSMFGWISNLNEISINNLNCTNMTNTTYMFAGTSGNAMNDLPDMDMSNVINCHSMFYDSAVINAPNMNLSKVKDTSWMFYECYKLKTVHNMDLSNATNTSQMFTSCRNLKTLPLELNTLKSIDMYGMFRECCNLTSIPNIDTSNAINISSIFYNCANVTSFPVLNISKTDSLASVFSHCYNLTLAPEMNTSHITNMSYLFSQCYNLTSVPNYNTTNVTNFEGLFSWCHNLMSIPNLDTSNATTISWMFGNLRVSSLPEINTSKVKNVTATYIGCRNVTTLPNIDTSNVISFGSMASQCSNLRSIPNFNTSKATDTSGMFSYCSNITSSPNFDLSNVTNCNDMFLNCFNLTTVPQFNLGKMNICRNMFTRCNNLSSASIQNIINSLLNSNIVNAAFKNLNVSNYQSPFSNSNITSSRYSNRLSELTTAGWTY